MVTKIKSFSTPTKFEFYYKDCNKGGNCKNKVNNTVKNGERFDLDSEIGKKLEVYLFTLDKGSNFILKCPGRISPFSKDALRV